MSHAQLERDRIALVAAIADEKKRHETADRDLRAQLEKVSSALQVAAAGVDLELTDRAESVLYVFGNFAAAGDDRLLQLECAMRDILTGCSVLREKYIGTKSYAHWYGQADSHAYGYGPKHGSIIFAIGLREEVRKREAAILTDLEIEACAYYLRNLARIQAARAVAKREAETV